MTTLRKLLDHAEEENRQLRDELERLTGEREDLANTLAGWENMPVSIDEREHLRTLLAVHELYAGDLAQIAKDLAATARGGTR